MIRDEYNRLREQGDLKADRAQAVTVEAMQTLSDELLVYNRQRKASAIRQLLDRMLGTATPPRGLYMWGDVGRGKTLLMNLFHEQLPLVEKRRLHFHHFMLDIHARLAKLQQSGAKSKNPLAIIAAEYAEDCRVLCLDEFIVTNITDAMLLYGLLDELFRNGMVLVVTSNRVPDDLYLNGLQRERFVPAIDLLKQHTRVIELDSDTDHRQELLAHSKLFVSPIDDDTDELLMSEFTALASGDVDHHGHVVVHKRNIPFIARSDEIAWFSYAALCSTPRATPDYIEIADRFRIIILSDVPVMDENIDDQARRFIYLIDELYDRRVTLIMSAKADIQSLYRGEMLAFAYRRTASRLLEMRSQDYLKESSQQHHE